MTRRRSLYTKPWKAGIAAVTGLLLTIAIAGVVALTITRSVAGVADRALEYDVELEDLADDLRVAVLDMRHYHRDIVFSGPSPKRLRRFEDAYRTLREEIDALGQLGIADLPVPHPDRLREMAASYYRDFAPAIGLYRTDSRAFLRASNEGLVRLDELEGVTQVLDKLGERRATAALSSVRGATTKATIVLVAVIVGLVLAGIALAYTVLRVLRELQGLYAAQQKATEQLAHSLQAKNDFIADASHELRTPLTVLRGNAEIGLVMEAGCAHGEILEEIVNESTRMSRLIEDLLLLARSDTEMLQLELKTVGVGPWLKELATRAEMLARGRGAEFGSSLHGEGEVNVDPPRVEQAVLGIVDNAAKYTPPGSRVTLSSFNREGELVIEVADRGPGIPEEELPLIFERFYRVDKTRARKQGGAGLGLAIAKTLVEAQGGRIEAASRVGEGTRMSIHLPLVRREVKTAGTVEVPASGARR